MNIIAMSPVEGGVGREFIDANAKVGTKSHAVLYPSMSSPFYPDHPRLPSGGVGAGQRRTITWKKL